MKTHKNKVHTLLSPELALGSLLEEPKVRNSKLLQNKNLYK